MAEDDTGGIFFQTAGTDESAAGALFSGSRDKEFLGVGVKRTRRVLLNDVIVDPFFDLCRCAGVNVVLRGVGGKRVSFFDRNQVVRMGSVIFGLTLRRDFIVW